MIKSQDIRILDVLVFGPAMIWASRYMPNDTTKLAMVGLGVGTILLNWETWRQIEKGESIQ